MKVSKIIASAVALAVASTPVVASAANPASKLSVSGAAQRAGAPVKGEKALGGGVIVAVLAAAAVIAGIIIVADDNNNDSSN